MAKTIVCDHCNEPRPKDKIEIVDLRKEGGISPDLLGEDYSPEAICDYCVEQEHEEMGEPLEEGWHDKRRKEERKKKREQRKEKYSSFKEGYGFYGATLIAALALLSHLKK